MESLIRSVYGRADAEYVIKKSRFIATVCEVKSEDEAAAFIEETLGCPPQLLGLPGRAGRPFPAVQR
jgi:predicted house-cleaning NTP pyrophosphatase (Maf/HAM1 superfamily)